MQNRSKEYLTTDVPWRALLVFLLPIVTGNLFQRLYVTVDSVIVGRLVGEGALAAIGACNALTNVAICVAIGGGIGASVIVGRDFGAKRFGAMKTAVFTALFGFLVLSLLIGGLGFFISRDVLVLMKTPGDVLDMATEYLKIYFLGLPFLFLYNVLSAMFNALGKSRIPLFLLIFSSLLNVGLDLLFVSAFRKGVAGVAWATLIAQGLSALLSLMIFLRTLAALEGEGRRLFSGSSLGEMSRIALPSILQQSTVTLGYLLVQSVVNGFGTEVMAGFSAAMRVEGVCVTFMTSTANAMSAFTAQNLGAGKPSRISKGFKAALALCGIFALLIFGLMEGLPEPIARLFLGKECSAPALKTAMDYMRFTGLFYAVFGVKQAVDGVLRGSGDTLVFTAANLVNLGLRVLIALLLAPSRGIIWVAYAVPIGWTVNSAISLWELKRGRWKHGLTVKK